MLKWPVTLRAWVVVPVAAVAILTLAATGCKKEEPAAKPSPPAESEPADESAEATDSAANTDVDQIAEAAHTAVKDEATAVLALADAKDGSADNVVSGCLMCGLRMKGSADHAVAHGDYTLQFCSAECQKHFEENPAAALAALDVPE